MAAPVEQFLIALHNSVGGVSRQRRNLQLLLPHNPPIGIPDPTYGGTPLGQCLYGSLHGWQRETGDFATTVRLLLEAGERPDLTVVPIGRDEVDAVLREHFVRLRRTQSLRRAQDSQRHS